jgi:uncharacterized RDD family membrane protein YckC
MSSYQNVTESSYGSYNRLLVFEGVSVRLVPAPLLKRIFAYLIDMAIVTAVLYIFLILFYIGIIGTFVTGAFGSSSRGNELGIFFLILLLILVVFSAYDGYFIYHEYKKGATFGKKLFGLQVIAMNRPRLSLGQCFIRDFFRLVDCALLIPGLLCIAITKNHQRLGDLAAGTMVVYSRQKEAQTNFVYLTQEQYLLYKETLAPLPVPIDTCERFLQFAYAEFITHKNQGLTPEQYTQWESVAQYYVPEAKNHPIDRTSLFLFFAENCLQTLNQKESNLASPATLPSKNPEKGVPS